jgi:hypothetical protein
MRAILVCAEASRPLGTLTGGAPAALLPLVDRPFLEHVLERLATQGVRHVDLLLSDGAAEVERVVGDGRRWGLEVAVHLARDAYRPYRSLPKVSDTNTVLIGHADRLPAGDWGQMLAGAPSGPVLLVSPQGGWSGWAVLPGTVASEVPGDLDFSGLADLLAGQPAARVHRVAWMLDVSSASALLDSQRLVMEGRVPEVPVQARRIAPDVWAGRGAVIDPAAVVTGPVFIGELAEIAGGARLGPNTVVAAGSVINSGTTLSECLIAPHGYVGPSLELSRAIVAGHHLLNVDLGVVVEVPDRALLAPLAGDGSRPVGWGSRLVAALALGIMAPVLLVTMLALAAARGRVWYRRKVLRTPASGPHRQTIEVATFEDPEAPGRSLWSVLFLRTLPLLRHVVTGHLGVVGTEPRTLDEAEALPPAWAEQIIRVRPGLITEGLVFHGPVAGEPDRVLADAWYAAHSSRRYDVRLLRAFAMRLIGGRPVPVPVPQA